MLVVERWIMARLRNRRFFSLVELNQTIAELVADLNARPMRRLGVSRRDLFSSWRARHRNCVNEFGAHQMEGDLVDSKFRSHGAYSIPNRGLSDEPFEKHQPYDWPDTVASLIMIALLSLGLCAYSDDVGRAFRLMSATCSDRSRPAVPIDVGRGGGAPAGWL